MSELVDFLTARLDEDEAVARAATDGGYGWRLTGSAGANEVWADRDAAGHDAFMVATTATRLNPNPGARGYDDAVHIARHDPARVLREVAAKRAILALHDDGPLWDVAEILERDGEAWEYVEGGRDGGFLERDAYLHRLATLRALALPFSDHPDFQEQWR